MTTTTALAKATMMRFVGAFVNPNAASTFVVFVLLIFPLSPFHSIRLWAAALLCSTLGGYDFVVLFFFFYFPYFEVPLIHKSHYVIHIYVYVYNHIYPLYIMISSTFPQ